MNAVWKFPIRELNTFDIEMPTGELNTFDIEMPTGAKLLSAGTQNGQPYLCALVDPYASKVRRKFAVVGTGHERTDIADMSFVGTFMLHGGSLVFHVFDGGEPAPVQPPAADGPLDDLADGLSFVLTKAINGPEPTAGTVERFVRSHDIRCEVCCPDGHVIWGTSRENPLPENWRSMTCDECDEEESRLRREQEVNNGVRVCLYRHRLAAAGRS